MMKSMSVLDRLDDESVIELIDNAYNYLLDKKSVPIKKAARARRGLVQGPATNDASA